MSDRRRRRHGVPRHRGEGGFTAVSFMLVVGLSLLPMVWFANFGVYLYGRGAVRSALDEGARAGARVDADSVAECQRRAQETLSNVLGGTMGRDVTVSCDEQAGVVRARATVYFHSFMPPVPDWRFQATAAVLKEGVT